MLVADVCWGRLTEERWLELVDTPLETCHELHCVQKCSQGLHLMGSRRLGYSKEMPDMSLWTDQGKNVREAGAAQPFSPGCRGLIQPIFTAMQLQDGAAIDRPITAA